MTPTMTEHANDTLSNDTINLLFKTAFMKAFHSSPKCSPTLP